MTEPAIAWQQSPSQTPRLGNRAGADSTSGESSYRVAAEARADLAPLLRGDLLTSDDHEYDRARVGYNLVIDHRPAVIVCAEGAADVMAAVRFATERNIAIGVMNSGHSVSIAADGGMLINTARMQGLHIDPQAKVATIDAGVRWDRVIHECAAHGLAPPSGSAPMVGAVGYTLGGGLPLLGRTIGYAADYVDSVDIVTTNGAMRRADATRFSDLFWGVRGGKGNFGVVTSMRIGLLPIQRIYGGSLIFRGSDATTVLHAYRRWLRDVPEELSSSVALVRFPWERDVPEDLRGRFVVQVRIAYHGPSDTGAKLLAPLRTLSLPIRDTVRDMSFTESATIHDDPTTPFPLVEGTACLNDWDEDAVDRLLHLAGSDSATPLRLVEIRHLGGALSRPPTIPNAVDNREASFLLYCAGVAGQEPTNQVRRHADEIVEQMSAWATGGAQINFLGAADADPDRVRTAYSTSTYRRLVSVKRAYDPENLFRINHNIPPDATAAR